MKEKIREAVISCGADLCGFAGIERFEDTPDGFSPADFMPGCKMVISFAVSLGKGLVKVPPRLVYAHFNDINCIKTDLIAFDASKKLEEQFGCTAVPIPCDAPYEYWDIEETEGKGLLSMKDIAVKAGLGTVGKSTLLLNKRYGSMLTLGAVLIDLELESDAYAEDVCIKGCRKCIESCPVSAIGDNTVNQKLCRQNAYGKTARGFDTVDCNLCRTVCPVNNKYLKQ